MSAQVSLLVLLITTSITFEVVEGKHVGCYYGTWAYSKFGLGTFVPEDIDVELCDVIYYGFGNILNDTYELCSYDPWFDLGEQEFSDHSIPNCIQERDGEQWPPGCVTTGGLEYCHENGIRRTVALKEKNPNLKVIFSVGGYNAGGWIFSQMTQTESTRLMFIQSVIHFLKYFNLDGLDLDWEYPGNDLVSGQPTDPMDKENLSDLLTELRFFFDLEGYLLTGAVAQDPQKAEVAYELNVLAETMDWVNIMLYDYGGPWNGYTGNDAPLYKRPNEAGEDSALFQFNIHDCVQWYLDNGFPAEKISLGIHTQAKAWVLDSPSLPWLDCPGSSAPNMTFSQQPGWLNYYEVLQFFYNETIEDPLWGDLIPGIENWTIEEGDGCSRSPHAYQGKYWISYDDEASVSIKARYANHYGLKGAFVWEVDTDNFQGMWGKEKFTILSAINRALISGEGLRPEEQFENSYPACNPRYISCDDLK